jgi:hypothetical protein
VLALERSISILTMRYSKADKPRRGSMRSDKSAIRVESAKANLPSVPNVSTY